MSVSTYKKLSPKLIAILRGITFSEVDGHIEVLLEAGFRAVEIPLNSPEPFRSIERAVRVIESSGLEDVLVGAGTVLSANDVTRLHDVGANLIVSPNINPEVVKSTVSKGMVSLPGVMTPSEAFQAIDSGATALKLFPASQIGVDGLRALKAVLPSEIDVLVVGGIDASNFSTYFDAGAVGVGLGSSLYRVGQSRAELSARAQSAMTGIKG